MKKLTQILLLDFVGKSGKTTTWKISYLTKKGHNSLTRLSKYAVTELKLCNTHTFGTNALTVLGW